MEINLKELSQQKEQLKYIQSVLADNILLKSFAKRIAKTIRFYEEIETDLELAGESIVELDKPRLKAIEERNKWLNIYNKTDDF